MELEQQNLMITKHCLHIGIELYLLEQMAICPRVTEIYLFSTGAQQVADDVRLCAIAKLPK